MKRATARGATLRDVARESGVSIASASRVINGIDVVGDELRDRVLKTALRLNYIPHSGARSLVTKRTNTIAVLLPDIFGEFFSELIRGIDVCARTRGFHILVSGSHGEPDEAAIATRAIVGRVDGLLIMSPSVETFDLANIVPKNLPIVTLSSRSGGYGYGSISVDNFAGAAMATQHLFDQGCRDVVHISGPEGNYEAQERIRGYQSVVERNGGKPRIYVGDFSEKLGFEAVKAMQAENAIPDGIFGANDMLAIGAMMGLREAAISVPEQVKIIGFDDIPVSRLTAPSLSSIRVGIYELGYRGLELLSDALQAADEITQKNIQITPELIIRDSSL